MKVIVSQELTYQYVKEEFAKHEHDFNRLLSCYKYYKKFAKAKLRKPVDFETFCVEFYLNSYNLVFRDYRELQDELLQSIEDEK